MNATYLLDTNIVSFLLKGNKPNIDRWMAKVPRANIWISAVTEAELRYGLARLPQPAKKLEALVEKFLHSIRILPWDSDAAGQYAGVRAGLERNGTALENLDMMIASQALSLGAVLVTNDSAFLRIQQLKCADWTKP